MEPWPIEYADQLILGNPTSNAAVCCLWSSKSHLREVLHPESYCVIGNLYSRAGINSMLRNILSNPLIRYLVLTGKSLTDSDDALLNFFKNGVDDDWRIVNNGAQIDFDFPMESLSEVRRSVELIDLRGTRQFEAEYHELIKRLEPLPPFAEPRSFPKTPLISKTFPSEFVGFVVRQRTVYQAWSEAIWTVMTFGHTSATDYGLEQKEVLALLSIIEEPASPLDRAPHYAPFTGEDLENYVQKFFDPQKQSEVAYNYGYRLQSHWSKDQLQGIAAELRRSGSSRRAVASLWDPSEDSGSSDPVCLTTIQAAVRSGRLHLMTYIRSNDMFRAYPLNAAALAALQIRVANFLGDVEVGPLAILSYSAHIYSDCWEECQFAIAEADKLHKKFEQDPRGSFVFRIEDGCFIAEHYSPDGDMVQSFRAKSEKELAGMVLPFVSRVDHAMYLAREIARLGSALERGERYEQDRVPDKS
jgi:thymidylate synthase